MPSCSDRILVVLLLAGICIGLEWWDDHPTRPIFSIGQFYVPALDKTTATVHGTLNTTVTFDLQIKNPGYAVYYDVFNVTLYYGDYFISPIGSISMPGFRQGADKTARRIGTLNITDVCPWEFVMEDISNGRVAFRVSLSTVVKYTQFSRHGGRHELQLGAVVHVNYYGNMAGMDMIDLELLWSDSDPNPDPVLEPLLQGPNEESSVGLAAA